MAHLNSAAQRLLRRQHGAISTEQLHRVGYTERQREALRRNHVLVPVILAAYRSPVGGACPASGVIPYRSDSALP